MGASINKGMHSTPEASAAGAASDASQTLQGSATSQAMGHARRTCDTPRLAVARDVHAVDAPVPAAQLIHVVLSRIVSQVGDANTSLVLHRRSGAASTCAAALARGHVAARTASVCSIAASDGLQRRLLTVGALEGAVGAAAVLARVHDRLLVDGQAARRASARSCGSALGSLGRLG